MKENSKIILVVLAIIFAFGAILINQDDIVGLYRYKSLSFSRSQLEILPSVILKRKLWQDDETVVFIHVPKTAGTNLVNLINAIVNVDPKVKAMRASVPRIDGRSPNLFTEGDVGGLDAIKDDISNFNGSKEHLNFISGHMPVPEINEESELFGNQRLSYISFVRDPIERELSSANFDFQRGYIEESDLKSYLLNISIDNPQTRLLAGRDSMSGECTEDTLKKAKDNIKNRFAFVALSEDAEMVMSIMANYFGFDNVAYARAQITGMKAITIQDPELYAELAFKHKYDLELYDWVKKEWESWKGINIESVYTRIDTKGNYLTLMPDFYGTERPEIMTSQQIEEYNKENKQKLIPVHSNF